MAAPANVVPFGPEAQVIEAVALTISSALRNSQRRERTAALQARVQLDSAAGYLGVLIESIKRSTGQTGKPIAVSPAAEEALRSVVALLGNRALGGIKGRVGPLGLEDLLRLQAELRECGSALDLLLSLYHPGSIAASL